MSGLISVSGEPFEFLWSHKSAEERQIDLINRKVKIRICQCMKTYRGLGEFEKANGIDCDFFAFWSVFGSLPRYLFRVHKTPKCVDKEHVKVIRDAETFKSIFGYDPPVKTVPKQNVECKMVFPMVVCYRQDETLLILIKYEVFNSTTGLEIIQRRSTQGRSAILRSLLRSTQQ